MDFDGFRRNSMQYRFHSRSPLLHTESPRSPQILVKKPGFIDRQLVTHACVFMEIVGSSFIFNIFFVSAPLPYKPNSPIFNKLIPCLPSWVSLENSLTNCLFINIVASGAPFGIFRAMGLAFEHRKTFRLAAEDSTGWNLPSSSKWAERCRPTEGDGENLACGFRRLDGLGWTEEGDLGSNMAAPHCNTHLVYHPMLRLSRKIYHD
jgi:hypothetical protein